jgi:hypothetical protein
MSYEETQMQNTENEPDERTSNIPEEPKSNTEQPITCIFNRGHTNISRKKIRQHLRKCKERVKLKQSMLESDDKRKVKGARGTTRVKGESYRQGEIYISSIHAELGQVEACYYDACHYIINSSTRYQHCGDCCARISKGGNSIDNSGGDPNHCWWCEMAENCPAWHTPMEHHHLHRCENYETKEPNVLLERD